ncbi:MAG: SDR family NAD(P)-dependent oxidoreductase [Chloroflexota bacterium]
MKSKAVVITGASTGIGKTCALALDKLGFQVFAGVRKQADADALREAGSDQLTPVFLDVVDDKSISAAVKMVANKMGNTGLMGLVNNAGVASGGPMEFLALDETRRVLEINLLGQIAVTQAFLPLLRTGRGRIVNISSISGLIAAPFVGPYTISKFGFEAFSDVLRRELMPWDIHVAIIEPGRIKTPIWEKSFQVVSKIKADLPDQAYHFYGQAFDTTMESTLNAKYEGTPPEAVAQAVIHALTARRPKLRYPVGKDAKLISIFSRFTPPRWIDTLLAKQRGLG